jgi:dGTPase
MQPLLQRIQQANGLLAPYAVPHEGRLGRASAEPEDETRFPFQRDRDRIIHSTAFRRLKGKTQVFIASEGDHHRTRLTHTMEVAQVSRDIARTLRLNEDLAECIALAHDLGHPPFGHAGEAALDLWMRERGLRFEHNEQSHRIVTLLEEHSSLYQGLNLNQEILEGLLKHRTPHDHPPHLAPLGAPSGKPSARLPRAPSLEAQIVNIADEIAYSGHDCDDGLRAEAFPLEELLRGSSLAKQAWERASARGTSLRGALIHDLVMNLYGATEDALASQRITTLDDVYALKIPLVAFSPPVRAGLEELRGFLWKRLYFHPKILERNQRSQEVLQTLCDRLFATPADKVTALQQKTGGALAEAVKDYVAGMTDQYAEHMGETQP